VSSAAQEAGMYVEADIHQVKCKLSVDTAATVSIVSTDMYQKIPDVARPTLTSTNQEVLTASGDKLKILGRGNFLMRLDDTKDVVVQALVAQITVDGIIGLDCMRSNAGLIDLQNSMLEVDGRRLSLKYAGKLLYPFSKMFRLLLLTYWFHMLAYSLNHLLLLLLSFHSEQA
jgi:hypothetical protein